MEEVMVRSLCLAAMLLIFGASSVPAAVVSFRGTITSKVGTGGALNLAIGNTFVGGLYVNDSVTNSSTISGGVFQFSNGLRLGITGGTVDIVGGNSIQFSIGTGNSNPPVLMAFSFTGVTGLGTGVNNSQFERIVWSTTSFNMLDNGVLPFYEGSITAVPEPSSAVALAGLALGGGFYRWRNRRKQASV